MQWQKKKNGREQAEFSLLIDITRRETPFLQQLTRYFLILRHAAPQAPGAAEGSFTHHRDPIRRAPAPGPSPPVQSPPSPSYDSTVQII
jgi:hypothetical protein